MNELNEQREQPEQQRQWIRDLVTAYGDRLVEHRRAEEKRVREEQEMQQQQANRLTPEVAGEQLWGSLRETLMSAVTQFNEMYGAAVMGSQALQDGRVKIHLSEQSGVLKAAKKLANVSFFRDTATLRWRTDVGKENSLGVGLNPESDQMEFAGAGHYFKVEQVASQIISDLLPGIEPQEWNYRQMVRNG